MVGYYVRLVTGPSERGCKQRGAPRGPFLVYIADAVDAAIAAATESKTNSYNIRHEITKTRKTQTCRHHIESHENNRCIRYREINQQQ